jgi:hypothetical protein
MRAMQGWDRLRSPEEWHQMGVEAREHYRSGRFVIERLGAERFLEPQLMATLWQLRQSLMEESGTASPAMTMVIDLAVMTYSNALRIQGWIEDLALVIERECFAEEALKVKLRQQYGRQVEGFAVEDALQRLKEQLLPLCERVNRPLLQNLQALQRTHPGPSPMVAIGQAGHVSVARQQVNLQTRDGRVSSPVHPR